MRIVFAMLAATALTIYVQGAVLIAQENVDLAALADRYAPQLMHPNDEPNLPANVDWFLQKTNLLFHNAACFKDDKSVTTPAKSVAKFVKPELI